MIETTLVFGVVIFAGMAAVFAACPLWLRQFVVAHHLFTSLLVTALTLWIHWGTMTGLMSATVAGLVTSLACFAGRWYWRMA
jgi:hypothetical protein